MKVTSLSHIQLIATPWTAAYQAPLSMGFSRQEYWSGVPLPSPTISIHHCREGSLQETWFSLATVSSLLGGFRPRLHPVFKIDDRLQDGVSPAFLTLAPTLWLIFCLSTLDSGFIYTTLPETLKYQPATQETVK